jgi:flagellar basal-body rod protein FlgC
MALEKSMIIAASEMRAQGTRLRVIAENIANAGSMAETTGGEPYRRKTVTFSNLLDRELGRHDPTHPAADAAVYIKTPNVKIAVEMMDFREAQRSYEANLNMIEVSRTMLRNTLELLR